MIFFYTVADSTYTVKMACSKFNIWILRIKRKFLIPLWKFNVRGWSESDLWLTQNSQFYRRHKIDVEFPAKSIPTVKIIYEQYFYFPVNFAGRPILLDELLQILVSCKAQKVEYPKKILVSPPSLLRTVPIWRCIIFFRVFYLSSKGHNSKHSWYFTIQWPPKCRSMASGTFVLISGPLLRWMHLLRNIRL